MKRFVFVMMAVLIGMPSAVLAHAHLIRSTPQDGSEISAPIDPVFLYFTEALEQRLINVVLSRDDKAVSGLSRHRAKRQWANRECFVASSICRALYRQLERCLD
ncbi:methionine-rich copper-binding protein CopC [Bradyrhizobium japonicum]